MYLTYSEYQAYGGTLDETAFNAINYDAKVKIDYHTRNCLKDEAVIGESVKRAVFKIIDLINTHNNYEKIVTDVNVPVVTSHSNDGVSETYGGYLGNTSPQDMNTLKEKLDKDIWSVIKLYLDGERNSKGQLLLYRGVFK